MGEVCCSAGVPSRYNRSTQPRWRWKRVRVHITGGRQLQDCNHEVELVPAHKVTPYAQGIKNDINDIDYHC